ncbi:GNAT family N-acetyltransferase [Microbacterium sp. NPDC058345]|uniref:GNAT family N-acetyltransferase n=1 Tax=Microbacterium sp. NPDC058345 TaxID=3346455 RepID=UPI0036618609
MASNDTGVAHVNADVLLVQEPDRNRWAAKVGDRTVGALTYQFAGNRFVLISTHVDTDHRHQGLATRLAIDALDHIQTTGKKITVICPFIGDVIARHPGYFDLVDPVHPGSGISGTAHGASRSDVSAAPTAERDGSATMEADGARGDGVAQIMVLGAIAFRGPLAMAGVAEMLREWEVRRWATFPDESIERQIRVLADSGAIEQEAQNSGEVRLRCTQQGRDQLHQLLLRLLTVQSFEPFNLLPLLYFIRVLTPAELADGLRRRILSIDEVLAYESSVISRSTLDGADHSSEIVRLNWHRYNADRSWSLEFIGRLYGAADTGASAR